MTLAAAGMDLSGYELELLRDDGEFALYRARPAGIPGPVLLLVEARAAARAAARLENEYALAAVLESSWAARPLALDRRDGATTLVLEDNGGDPLDRLLKPPLELAPFLRLAVCLAGAVEQVHRHGFIHKDVRPANVLVDAAGEVRLTGFGMASRLPRERQVPAPPEVIAGTFAYMAPEQTGRMNRSIDARADLYSLGVTLYEILTGALPFTASDPMEWIHCHVARQPVPPSGRVRGVPHPVDAIVLKLLAKTAENRYQTAAGVEADLRHCLTQWEARGRIDPFPLGTHDGSDRLLIPERLYGREAEIASLLAAFDRVAAQGATELVLVSGYSGVGKSSVVNELHKALVPSRGLFATGKFEQYKRDIPYATMAQAFKGLVYQLLSKNDVELGRWRQALLEALGPNGELIVVLIPELALIVGEQPPVPPLPPAEAQHRFQTVFRRFVGVFAQPDHPLALFLDDLQWLDGSTLELIEHLAAHPEVRHLLLVGAYRDNEVEPSHPLVRTLETICKAQARVHEIVLAPLRPDDLGQMVADALRCERGPAQPLAQLVHDKTDGNPFFAIHFLTALAEENLLAFDYGASEWRWDLPRIRAKGFTDNVVDLMAAKLARLPPATRDALGQLACLGNVAASATLARVHGGSEAEIHAHLWEAVRAGLVFRRDDGYAFLHDRVHEAAYALLPEAERTAEHLRIGRLLARSMSREELEEHIFEVVNQLNRAAASIVDPEERDRVAELNLAAARRAKLSNAYRSAIAYLAVGRALLAEDCWRARYRLAFELEYHRAECEFLTGEPSAAEERLAMLSRRAENIVDRAAVTWLHVTLATTLNRSDLAVELCLDHLRYMGIYWSAHPSDDEVRAEHQLLWRRLGERSVEELIDLPLMTDPKWRATLDLLTAVQGPAMFTDQNLLGLVAARMANLSLAHGHCDGSCFAYVWLGFVLGSRFGDYAGGYRFGKLGLELVDRRGLDRFKPRVYLAFGQLVVPWVRHLRTSRELVKRAFVAASEAGDLTYASYSFTNLVTNLLASGDPLPEVEREAEAGLDFAGKARFGLVVAFLTAQLRLVRALRGLTPELGRFDDDGFDEGAFERELEADPHLAIAACWYWIRKLQAHLFAGEHREAIAAGARAERLLWSTPSQFEVAEYRFHDALARAAVCAGEPGHRDAIAAHGRELSRWAESCPENFAARAALVAAELARIDARELEAERQYERAIREARAHGFVQVEALANELAARFYAARGFATIAAAYLRNARECYLRWGADGKVRLMDRDHPETREEPPRSDAGTTAGTPVEHLDLATVVNVSLAVSGEIDARKVVDTVMRTALETAGAERGVLILPRGDGLTIEADGRTVRDAIEVRVRRTPVTPAELPESLLRYVVRTRDSLVVEDAWEGNAFSTDAYIRQNRCRSILCLPLIKQAKLIAILYLENNLAPRAFTPARLAVLKLLASQAAISLDNARLVNELQRAEAYLAEAQRLSHTGSFGWNASTGEIVWSEETFHIFEQDRSVAPSLEQIFQRTHPDDRPRVKELVARRTSEAGNDWELEHRLLMPDGSVKHLHVVARAVNGESQDVQFAGAVMDVTSAREFQDRLQASLEEKDALLKEVHHRVKNNLQLISSLLSLQAARIADRSMAELFADSRNRVRSIALVHENLYRAGDFARVSMEAHIQKLCTHLVRAFGLLGREIDLTCDVDDVELDLERATSAGLIINELVSNAVKHAFPDGRAGRIRVELKLRGEKRCVLAVIDDGVGLPPDVDRDQADSLGLQIVHDLADQLHGAVHVSREGGTSFTITFGWD